METKATDKGLDETLEGIFNRAFERASGSSEAKKAATDDIRTVVDQAAAENVRDTGL